MICKSILDDRIWSENPPHPKIERLKHPWNSMCNWWFCRIVFLCSFMLSCSYDLMSLSDLRIARILTFFPIFVYLFRCEPVFFRRVLVSWFGASVVSYLHGSSDSSASLSSQPVSLFLYLFCIFFGVRSFSRRWFHIRPNNQLLKPKFASNIRFIAFLSTKQRFRVRGRFGVWVFFI